MLIWRSYTHETTINGGFCCNINIVVGIRIGGMPGYYRHIIIEARSVPKMDFAWVSKLKW